MFRRSRIRACKGVMDLGDQAHHGVCITAREIAEDIARELKQRFRRRKFSRRVFVAAGPEPIRRQLAQAQHVSTNFIADWSRRRSRVGAFA